MKKTWSLINELRGTSKSNIKASFVINGKVVEDRREIANEFNTFFSSIARKLNTKVNSSTLNTTRTDLDLNTDTSFLRYLDKEKNSCNSMFMSLCTKDEIAGVISELDNNKASDIAVTILKKCSGLILDYLVMFYNFFIENSVFPIVLKKGLISPVFKKDDPRYLDNYRPVSTLLIFGKILEKIIYRRLYSFFLGNGTIYENQFGFRKYHSTSHAVNTSVDHILKNIEREFRV